jgi:hypothetical protein
MLFTFFFSVAYAANLGLKYFSRVIFNFMARGEAESTWYVGH